MSNRLSDQDVEQMLAGATPAGQPEFSDLTGAIAEFRIAAHDTIARPSAAVMARLDLPVSVEVSGSAVAAAGSSSQGTASAEGTAEQPTTRGYKKMFEWIAGLGLAAKIAAGTGVLALGLTGVGAAGALPGPAQTAFDSAVETVLPQSEEEVVEEEVVEGDELVDESLPVGSDEFSKWVSEGAQDPDKVGSEFGAAVSEQARELRDEKAAERAEERGEPGERGRGADKGDDDGDESELDDSTDDSTATDSTKRGGKPDAGNRGKRP